MPDETTEQPPVTLDAGLVRALTVAFASQRLQLAAHEHAGDPSCPYPHEAEDPRRCPVLASYLARDSSELAAERAAKRAADDIRGRDEEARRALEEQRRAAGARLRQQGMLR